MRPSLKCLLVVVVAAAVLSIAAPQANAQWCGYRGAWGCSYTPCYSPCYSSCYMPCCTTIGYYNSCNSCCGLYLGCRPGPIRRAVFGPYRWYWGGCYSGCYTGCATDCCSTPCCGDNGAAPAQTPTPAKKPDAQPPMPAEPPAPAPAAPKTTGMSSDESGILTVWVPYDAKVTVNGRETTSTGSQRRFVSFGLKPGLSYKYEIKAQIVRNGQTQEDTRTVVLKAGQVTAVAFGFNVTAQQVASAR